jgi:hypothetical protein
LKDKTLKILLASAFLYLIGYLPLFLEERFLIIPQIILILITFSFLNNVTNNYLRKGSYRWILLIIFFISITYKPIYSFYNNVNADKEYFVLADDLKDLHVNGNFAGLSTKPLSRDWGATLFLAYELNSKFYGEINSKFCSDSIYYNLKKNNIKYLFVWDKNKIISHPAINEIYVKNIKTYDNDNFVLNNKFVNKFYSLFNLNVTQKENKYLKLYKLN